MNNDDKKYSENSIVNNIRRLGTYFLKERNLLFSANSDFIIPISLDYDKPLKFQTMTFVRSKNISLKYQRFTTLGSKDIGNRKSEFVAKSQFLCQ